MNDLSANGHTPRKCDDGPWFWASKEAAQILHETFADNGMLASARSVYFALCQIASDNGRETFQISIQAICLRSGVCDRRSRTILQHLATAGLLAIKMSKTAGGLNLPSTYTLLCTAARPALIAARPATIAARPAMESPLPVPTLEERKEKKESTPVPPSRRIRAWDGDVEFSRFWDAYPRKIARDTAGKAWSKLGNAPPIDRILAALEAAKRTEQWTRDEGRYIPYPATWLSGRRWEDQFDTASLQPKGPQPEKELWREEWVPWLEKRGYEVARNREYQFADPLVKDAFWKERKTGVEQPAPKPFAGTVKFNLLAAS